LIDRLMQFFEEGSKSDRGDSSKASRELHN
jgi:hypothetical protein